ncbi:YkgJ family cysteine cluster protein [uncultured Polaribacter sp.]|uniref:YkgJ family cysteine cluster protein n=1 Tax=uncultured Polaribacter sp. TaxID=174711 RepID=UPI0030D74FA7|tara:strand:+ start:229 stop:1095 length:867 start_codon:yes stop_codon:yes gene_type:complete
MQTTKLSNQSILPLTCSRSGSCCFGKAVMLNPYELLCFSIEKKISVRKFRDSYTNFGGIQLLFNGKKDKKGQKACSQYVDGFGCSVHKGRPLACRLYPLGRKIQFNEAHYIYEGDTFPCLTDCAEVLELPKLSVGEYLKGQEAKLFEKAQDEYLMVMQNIADIAFELLLDSGLSKSGDTKTLAAWREIGNELPEIVSERIGKEWIDILMIPDITDNHENPIAFAQKHNDLLLLKAQEKFGDLKTLQQLHEACVIIMSVALHLARGLGANPKEIAEHFIGIAKKHGAKE